MVNPETKPEPQQPSSTLSAAELAGCLWSAIERSAVRGAAADQSSSPVKIDAEAWIEWSLAGLRVCTLPSDTTAPQERRRPWVPRLRDAAEAGRRFAANLAITRCGSIAQAAAGAATSRRSLRETLKRSGTYQPPKKTSDRASSERAVSVIVELVRGLDEAVIATAGGSVRVCLFDDFLRIEVDGEAPLDAGHVEALQALTDVLERLGGPLVGAHDGEAHDGDPSDDDPNGEAHDGENGGTDAI